jgi:aminopeptidase
MDPRATQLATVLIDHSLKVQMGDKLLVCCSSFLPLDLLHECFRLGVERGAQVELDVASLQMQRGRSDFGGFTRTLLEKASEDQLKSVSDLSKSKIAWADKFVFIVAINDDHFLAGIDPDKLGMWRSAQYELMSPLFSKTWVLTQYPTEGMAKEVGMSMPDLMDFYYHSCLIDYAEEAKRLQGLQDVLDAGERVHIKAPGTDLTIGIKGRLAAGTNLGRRNVPDGECFVGPEEDVTSGEIFYELPQVRDGNEVSGIHLVFEKGAVVKASAKTGESYLLKVLDDHPGNRRFGELGIGMNRNITQYMKRTLFDEKIAGTVHMALGTAYLEERGGGKNKGTIHWDLVKDLRFPGTLVTVDGKPIIRDGEVLV